MRPTSPSEVTWCPMCGAAAPYQGDTSIVYGGDESYRVRRYICEGLSPHTTWATYGAVRDLGYGDASGDAGGKAKESGTLEEEGEA